MVFAGGTLIAAVCGLTLTGISFLAWLGYAAGVVVLIAVAASLTLVPAILGVMGQRVLPKKPRPEDDPSHEELDKTVWAKLANAVTNKPWPFAIISTVILLVLAAPTLTLSLARPTQSNLRRKRSPGRHMTQWRPDSAPAVPPARGDKSDVHGRDRAARSHQDRAIPYSGSATAESAQRPGCDSRGGPSQSADRFHRRRCRDHQDHAGMERCRSADRGARRTPENAGHPTCH